MLRLICLEDGILPFQTSSARSAQPDGWSVASAHRLLHSGASAIDPLVHLDFVQPWENSGPLISGFFAIPPKKKSGKSNGNRRIFQKKRSFKDWTGQLVFESPTIRENSSKEHTALIKIAL